MTPKPGDTVAIRVGTGRVNARVLSVSATANRSGRIVVEFCTRAGKYAQYVRKPNQVFPALTCLHPNCNEPTAFADITDDVWCEKHKHESVWSAPVQRPLYDPEL